MLDLMYEIPSRSEIQKVVVTREAVDGQGAPTMMLSEKKKPARKKEETA